jgi:hypothetical protein
MKRAVPIHPFLFSFFFIAAPIVNYLWSIEPALAFRLLLLSVPVTLGIMGFLWLATRDLQHSAFVCTLLWISLGLTSMPLLTNVPAWIIPVRATWVALLALWALILLCFLPNRFWNRVQKPSRITFFMNVIGVCSIAYSAFMMVGATIRVEQWKIRHAGWLEEKLAAQNTTAADPPDIYYVILDGYGREDVLREIYGIDNSGFLGRLSEMGFFVARDGHANYGQTVLSLASSLNLQYLDEQIRIWGVDSPDRNLPTEMIHHSLARAFLGARGYRLVNIFSGFYPTDIPDADERLGLGRPYGINAYEQFWFMYSPFQELIPKDEFGQPTWGYAMHRERILRGFDSLARVSAEDGPKFVFAHILAAHPPFVFLEDGTWVEADRPYQLVDGDHFFGSRDEYLSGYAAQIGYINRRLLETMSAILDNARRPVVIVLQADHGPGSTLDWSGAERSCLWERASILNAYYLPEEYRAGLYPSITPVNTFRLIFRELFHADYPLLEDKVYYSTWNEPYRLTDIGDEVAGPCHG